MKPCLRNKKPISWLALNALDEASALKLRSHLETCYGCRQYWQEVSALCAVAPHAADVVPEAIADDRFHDRLSQRIQASDAPSASFRMLNTFFHGLVLRLSQPVPAIGTVAVLSFLVLWLNLHLTPPPSNETLVVAPAFPQAEMAAASPPTLFAYRMAANRSLDALDEMLVRQAERRGSGGEVVDLRELNRRELEN